MPALLPDIPKEKAEEYQAMSRIQDSNYMQTPLGSNHRNLHCTQMVISQKPLQL